jgi:septal ring factor EnvC (AmiA/AmiB activator)
MQQTTRRLDRHESDIAQLRDAVGQVKATNDDIREDVRGLRQDIQSLTSTLLSNMRDDQQRERDMGSLKEQIAVIVSTEGAKAGSKAGAAAGIKWALGTVATMLPSLTAIFWLYAWLHGLNSPPVFRP